MQEDGWNGKFSEVFDPAVEAGKSLASAIRKYDVIYNQMELSE